MRATPAPRAAGAPLAGRTTATGSHITSSKAQPGVGGGFRAAGGPVSSGMPYIVGERGPELFVPSSSGRIAANGSGGGMVLQTTIHIDSRTDQAQVAQLVAEAAADPPEAGAAEGAT